MSVLLTPKGSFSDSKDMHSVAEITLWNPRVLTEKKKITALPRVHLG